MVGFKVNLRHPLSKGLCFIWLLIQYISLKISYLYRNHIENLLYTQCAIMIIRTLPQACEYWWLVYTTQVNSTFRARWLASLEVISQVLFTSEQPIKNKIAFVAIFSQMKLLFGPLVIQLVWYILKQLFTSVSVKVVDINLHFGE